METRGKMRRHLRIVAQQVNELPQDAAMLRPAQWKELGFSVEQLSHIMQDDGIGSCCYDPDKIGPRLRQYLAENRKNGLATILYVNAHMLHHSGADNDPKFFSYDAQGKILKCYGEYPLICQYSDWPAFIADFLKRMAGFDLEGIFFDGPTQTRCRCPRCEKIFRSRFGHGFAQGNADELSEHARTAELQFRAKLRDAVHQADPDWLCYFNEPVYNARFSADEEREAIACNDIVGSEGGFFFYGAPYSMPVYRASSTTKMLEELAPDKIRVNFMAGDRRPWSWFRHEPAETALCYAATLANGGSIWYGFHSDPPPIDGPTGNALKELLAFDRDHADLYEDTRSRAESAVFYSFDTARISATAGESSDLYNIEKRDGKIHGNYQFAFHGAVAAATHLNYAFDILSDVSGTVPERIKVIFLPNAAMLSDRSAEALMEFVRRGGTLIADGEPLGAGDKARAAKWMETLFGVLPRNEIVSHGPVDYFRPDPGFYRKDGHGLLPMTDYNVKFIPGSARSLAVAGTAAPGSYNGKPRMSDQPYITLNSFGLGKAYYIGGNFFEGYRTYEHPDYRFLLETMAGREQMFRLLNASEAVEFSVRECHDGSLLASLVNYTSALRPIVKSIVQRDAVLKCAERFGKITALRNGKTLVQEADGFIRLPEIGEWEVIHLQK